MIRVLTEEMRVPMNVYEGPDKSTNYGMCSIPGRVVELCTSANTHSLEELIEFQWLRVHYSLMVAE